MYLNRGIISCSILSEMFENLWSPINYLRVFQHLAIMMSRDGCCSLLLFCSMIILATKLFVSVMTCSAGVYYLNFSRWMSISKKELILVLTHRAANFSISPGIAGSIIGWIILSIKKLLTQSTAWIAIIWASICSYEFSSP